MNRHVPLQGVPPAPPVAWPPPAAAPPPADPGHGTPPARAAASSAPRTQGAQPPAAPRPAPDRAAPPAPAEQRRRARGGSGAALLRGAAIVLALAAFLFPFAWMLLGSFKTALEIIQMPPRLLFRPTLANYAEVFGTQHFLRFFWNSLVIAAGSTGLGLALGLPAAYAIARYAQNGLALLILVARMVPGISFLIPWFILFRSLHLVDTYTALILTHMLVGLPFIIWVMVPFFAEIPRDIEEAALVDGLDVPGAFWRVVLPVSGPGIVTAGILAFVFSWNNFMFSVVLAADRTKTLPVAIFNFISYAEIDWGGLMAASVVITLPVLVLALLTQRYVVRGLTAGAVKG